MVLGGSKTHTNKPGYNPTVSDEYSDTFVIAPADSPDSTVFVKPNIRIAKLLYKMSVQAGTVLLHASPEAQRLIKKGVIAKHDMPPPAPCYCVISWTRLRRGSSGSSGGLRRRSRRWQ